MNWRNDIFTKIVQKLTPLKTNGKLQYIDLDKGQIDNSSKTHPIAKPAVLIEIQNTGELEHMTNNYVEGKTAIVTLLVVMDNRHLSFQGSESFNDSLAINNLLDEVTNATVFTIGDQFDALHLVSEGKLPNQFDGLQRHLITFSTQIHFQLNPQF